MVGLSMMEVKRDDTTPILSEHYRDGTPGTRVFIETDGLDALQKGLTKRQNHL